ncbi:MAG: TIGR00269 family protein [Candidatus Woesearchaeota archaeon]
MEKLPNTKFKSYVEKKVRNTIRKYSLFSRDDKIGVAVSGGKDSTACLYILKKLGYDIEAITIDASIGNYTKQNLENLKKVCDKYKVKLHVVSFRDEFGMSLCYIRSVLKSKGIDYSSCMLCGILKRYLLNKHARKLKFDCLATGHNLDDEAQAFLMNVFRNDFKLAKRQGPVTGSSKSSKFVKRVKPLYEVREDEAGRYSKIMKFPVNYGICPCSASAYRREYLNLLDEFEKKHPCVKYNLVRFHETMKASLKKEKSQKVGLCSICGEPASNDVCKACNIFRELKIAGK